MRQLTQAHDLERRLDVSALVEVKSFLCVLAVSDLSRIVSIADAKDVLLELT